MEGAGLRVELRPVGEGGQELARPKVVELGAEALAAEWQEDIVFEGPAGEAARTRRARALGDRHGERSAEGEEVEVALSSHSEGE